MRKWFCLVIVVLVFASYGFLLAGGAKPEEGKELIVSLIAGFPTNIGIKSLIPEYEEKTGMKVTVIDTGYGAILEKNLVDLSAQTGAYDVIHVETIWFAEYFPYLYPLNEFMEDPELFNREEFDFDDFSAYSPVILDVFTRAGKLYGFPHSVGTPLNWYRSDLLEEKGLKPPRNTDEFYEVAKSLTQDVDGDGNIDIYGCSLSGARTALVDEWLSIFFDYGGGLPSRPEQFRKATFNNPIGLKALRMYKRLYDECAPPESLNWEFGEVGSAMQRGIVAMGWNWPNGGSWFDDPETSTVVGKVRANVVWPGRFGINGLSIPKDAKNMEASFKFILWATSKDIMRRTVLAGGSVPCRKSVLTDPELTKEKWWFEPLYKVGHEGYGRLLLVIPEWSAMDDALAIEFQKVLSGERSPEGALDRASDKAYKILEDAGYFD